MRNTEPKYLIYWFLCLFIMLLSSCKSQKPIETKIEKKAFKFEYDSSLVKVIKTPDSNDSLFVSIPVVKTSKPECDSACQAKIDEILKGINTKKSNGTNKSGFYYDENKKLLVAYNNLKGSFDSITKQKSGKKEFKSEKENQTIPVNILTREQQFNIWTGRLFWLAIFVYGAFKVRKFILDKAV